MSDGFTKLFASLITSSVWSEDDATCKIWITILAITDQDGFCASSIPGLAALSRKSIDEVQAAVAKLEGPDPFSRTTADEGRRLKRVEGGWVVLNYCHYRDRERLERRREYMRGLMRDRRGSLAANGANKMLTDDNSSASASVSGPGEGIGEGANSQPQDHRDLGIWQIKQIIEAKQKRIALISQGDDWRKDKEKVREFRSLHSTIESLQARLANWPVAATRGSPQDKSANVKAV